MRFEVGFVLLWDKSDLFVIESPRRCRGRGQDYTYEDHKVGRWVSTEETAGTLFCIRVMQSHPDINLFALNVVNAILNRLARQGIANAVDVALMPESTM